MKNFEYNFIKKYLLLSFIFISFNVFSQNIFKFRTETEFSSDDDGESWDELSSSNSLIIYNIDDQTLKFYGNSNFRLFFDIIDSEVNESDSLILSVLDEKGEEGYIALGLNQEIPAIVFGMRDFLLLFTVRAVQ